MIIKDYLSCCCYIIVVFKLRLGASIPRSVGLSVCRSSKNYKKNYKTLQNITKGYKTFGKTVEEALAVCRSFLDGVDIFFTKFGRVPQKWPKKT